MAMGLSLGMGLTSVMGGGGPASAVWNITPGDTEATVNSFPTFTGTWSITPGDGQATVNTSPEVP